VSEILVIQKFVIKFGYSITKILVYIFLYKFMAETNRIQSSEYVYQ